MDFAQFDTRHYPTLPVQEGYGAWAATYEDTVLDIMDLRLLGRLQTVDWAQVRRAADLACGTGRIGVWLSAQGVQSIDGLDLTAAMLEGARGKGVYHQLYQGNLADTPLQTEGYDLVTTSLVDEHLPTVQPLYREAARITCAGGSFVIVGFHPYFLMNGVPTHFNSASGEPVTIECYVHLISDHIQAGLAAGLTLTEMHEGLIDADWLAQKPKWAAYRNRPVSFAMVWTKHG